MMLTKDEFAKAFQSVMYGKMSAKEFARLVTEYMNSPQYRRDRAQDGVEQLKRWREGREHLMSLIEAEKKAGTDIDYEILPLRDGEDSIKVIVNGYPTVCFPSFFSKEFIDLNWNHVVEAKSRKRRACGHWDCGTSTSIDDVTLTFGRGNLDDQGFWEIPCATCAADFKKDHPEKSVWPVNDAPK